MIYHLIKKDHEIHRREDGRKVFRGVVDYLECYVNGLPPIAKSAFYERFGIKGKRTKITSDVVSEVKNRVATNIGEIEAMFFEHSPPPSKASLAPNYSISGLKRLGARSDIILTYAVRRRRRDDYCILLSDYTETNLANFSIYVWIKPSAAAMCSYSHLSIDISSSRVKV